MQTFLRKSFSCVKPKFGAFNLSDCIILHLSSQDVFCRVAFLESNDFVLCLSFTELAYIISSSSFFDRVNRKVKSGKWPLSLSNFTVFVYDSNSKMDRLRID